MLRFMVVLSCFVFGGMPALSVLLCYENSQNIFQDHSISLTSDWWGIWKELLRRLLCAKKTEDKRAADSSGGLFAPSHALWRNLFHSCRPLMLQHVNKDPALPGESVHAIGLQVLPFSQIFHYFIYTN